MTNASIQNALECKISCSTSKVSYVLDTEDVFFRSRVPPGGYSAKSSAPPAKKAKKGNSKDKAVAVPQPARQNRSRAKRNAKRRARNPKLKSRNSERGSRRKLPKRPTTRKRTRKTSKTKRRKRWRKRRTAATKRNPWTRRKR